MRIILRSQLFAKLKGKQQVSISLALPALNEEQTVGNVIETIEKALVWMSPCWMKLY